MARDLQRLFRLEARELLEGLRAGTAQLDAGAIGADDMQRLLRLAHTLKGAARVAGHADLAMLVHDIEENLPPGGAGDRTALADVRRLIETIGGQIEALERGAAPVATPEGAVPAVPSAGDATQTLRVDLAEIAHIQARLGTLRRALGSMRHAQPDVERVLVHVAGLETSVEALRLVPVSSFADYVERAARDAAAALGKSVEIEVLHNDLRVEVHLLAAVRDALVQAVRNAVAHGIEDPATRLAAGKPPAGSITVGATQREMILVFTCTDDGRGIDLGAVRRLLVAAGRLSPAAERSTSDEAILDALMRHRLTSRATPSAHAGRGLGLDIVRDVAARLHGSARLTTRPGEGTTVEIAIPAEATSVAALLVESGGMRALLPLHAVRRVTRLSPGDLQSTERGAALLVDGRDVPLVSLGAVLGATAGTRDEPFAAVLENDGVWTALGISHPGVTLTTTARRLPPLAPVEPHVVAVAEVRSEIVPLLDPLRITTTTRQLRETMGVREARTPARVLVIDDSITTRMLEQSILESAGYTVDTAASGEEALSIARQQPYQLFVVDVEMPGMNGFEFIARARGITELAHVPSILVTSRDSAADRQRGVDVGARAYFVKSAFDQERLLEAVRDLVS